MRIKIIVVGKNKDAYIEQACGDFLKRLRPYFDLKVATVKEVSAGKTFSREKAMEMEGEQILARVGGQDFLLALDEQGRQMTSVEFAAFIAEKKDLGVPLTFVIGGPYGLSSAVKARANLQISFSKMTFTHQMIRIFLLEQLYRAICIINKKEYHNG